MEKREGVSKQQVVWEDGQTDTREDVGGRDGGILVSTGQRVARKEEGDKVSRAPPGGCAIHALGRVLKPGQ